LLVINDYIIRNKNEYIWFIRKKKTCKKI
jgi:hypothetical protein